MTSEKIYTYLGTNGSVTTPIHLEGIPAMVKIRLRADEGKVLTRDSGKNTHQVVMVSVGEVTNWKEIQV